TIHPSAAKVRDAGEIVKRKRPDIIIDGEMQADTATSQELMERTYPFSALMGKEVNTLIFPDMTSGNIAYKLLMKLGQAEAIGPIWMGMDKSVHVLQRSCEVSDIVNIAAFAASDAQ
ncbi:MAG: phosphate acyltransferase, partial [bacterium]|nr:phosphate acyltransferase [bacterium]